MEISEISELPDSEIPAGWEKAPDWDMGLVRVGIGARIWQSGSWMMYSPGISGWWVVDPWDTGWVCSYFTFGEDNDPDTVPTVGPFATVAEACAACPPDPAPFA